MRDRISCRQKASRLDLRVEDSAEGAVIFVRARDQMMVDQAGSKARMSVCLMSRASASW
jgi:hypothetical protein